MFLFEALSILYEGSASSIECIEKLSVVFFLFSGIVFFFFKILFIYS